MCEKHIVECAFCGGKFETNLAGEWACGDCLPEVPEFLAWPYMDRMNDEQQIEMEQYYGV